MQPIDSTNLNSFKWKRAATDALILASVTVVISTLNMLFDNSGLGILFWAVKFGGSLYLLYFLMKRYGKLTKVPSTFNYGVITCLLSSLVCAIYSFFLMSVLFPDSVTAIFDQVYQIMGTNMTDEMSSLFQQMESKYPQYAFFSSLIWDFIVGLVFSAIFTKSTSPRVDIFADTTDTDNNCDAQQNNEIE
ncbi:MAG: DUF4199 domain-containing protein [Bacteroidales bacterium]|jgi:hypothetical protein|nr:DUF4199 domain-containing protein [Bacteroidales bacterium]MDD3201098.1 DUF4199 domain-containing protein [Bacteroidales bacterium]